MAQISTLSHNIIRWLLSRCGNIASLVIFRPIDLLKLFADDQDPLLTLFDIVTSENEDLISLDSFVHFSYGYLEANFVKSLKSSLIRQLYKLVRIIILVIPVVVELRFVCDSQSSFKEKPKAIFLL